MMPDLHKFKDHVQPLTAKTWTVIPIYFKHFKIDLISVSL